MTDTHLGGQRSPRTSTDTTVRVLTTLLAWGAVYALLLTVFAVLGDRLESLPFPVRLLVVSGILVALMANIVMPAVTRLVHRTITGPSDT